MFRGEPEVIAFFSPSKWADALERQERSLILPDVTLRRLDSLYHGGISKLIVKENLRGIYHLAAPREPISEQALDTTASLIVAKFGGYLSAFASLYFFADYLTEFRSSFGRFDLQDVMRTLGRDFLPWWNERRTRAENAEAAERKKDGELRGLEARDNYLRREYVARGRSVAESHLPLTEEEIKRLDNEGKEKIF